MPIYPKNETELLAITRLIRSNFQKLKAAANGLHAGIGVNASQRAVMEWIMEHGQQTVPQVAAAKSVSRQHVQKVADELVEGGFARFLDNPAHKRSPFLALTARGEKTFTLMRARETELLGQLAGEWNQHDLKATRKFLAELEQKLKLLNMDFEHDDDH